MVRMWGWCCALALWCGAAAAGEIEFEGKVEKVTVYTSGTAGVTRAGAVKLEAGRSVIRSAPLPAKADPGSLQARLGGGVAIEAVETRRLPVDEKTLQGKRAEHARLLQQEEDRLFELQQELQAIDGRIGARNETLAFLDKMREQAAQTAGREMAVQELKVDSWKSAVDFAEQRAAQARKEIVELAKARRLAERSCNEQSRRYQELAAKYPQEIYETRAYITVNCEKALETRLELNYTVSGADWEPSYRAAADVKGKKLALEVFGAVSQSSGEDWTGVQLSLSTARPELGTDAPELRPWYIRPQMPPVVKSKRGRDETYFAPERSEDLSAPATPAAEDESGTEDGAEESPAEAVSCGMATVFTAEAAADIPSDGQLHKIPVSTLRSDIEVEHCAIPKIMPYAFVRATTANKAPFPLLPGIVDVVVGDSFVGRGVMKLTAPGEKIRLGLGVDESVKISLRLLEDKVERKRRGDNVATTNVFEIKLTSFAAEPIQLSVIDQLPISKDGEIKVTYGREASQALRGAEFPGQLKWERTLKPGENDRIEFDFTIEYPERLKQALEAKSNRVNDYNIDNVIQMPDAPAASGKAGEINAQPRYENQQQMRQVEAQVKF